MIYVLLSSSCPYLALAWLHQVAEGNWGSLLIMATLSTQAQQNHFSLQD